MRASNRWLVIAFSLLTGVTLIVIVVSSTHMITPSSPVESSPQQSNSNFTTTNHKLAMENVLQESITTGPHLNKLLLPTVDVNCSKLFVGDKEETDRVSRTMAALKRTLLPNAEVLQSVKNCTWLRNSFQDYTYNSDLELSFPLAFTFVVHDSPQQVLRLLRVLYRPQNTYCIHYDAKSEHKEFFESIADCFGNVIIPAKHETVVWGHYGVLGAQMHCLRALQQHRLKQEPRLQWKYLINLCGKELPLSTNRALIQQLMQLNGSSSIFAYQDKDEWVTERVMHRSFLNKQTNRIFTNHTLKVTPPFPLSQFYKSQTYVALSYLFTNFLVSNSTAKEYLQFFKFCQNPEEHFYATVFMLPGATGGYVMGQNYFRMENVFWMNSRSNYTCYGGIIHQVCIVSYLDLPNILSLAGTHVFHNKYFMERDPVVAQCLEERVLKANQLEYQQDCQSKGHCDKPPHIAGWRGLESHEPIIATKF